MNAHHVGRHAVRLRLQDGLQAGRRHALSHESRHIRPDPLRRALVAAAGSCNTQSEAVRRIDEDETIHFRCGTAKAYETGSIGRYQLANGK